MNTRSKKLVPHVGLHPALYVGFKNEFQELLLDSLVKPNYLRSTEVSCYNFGFSLDECSVLERLGDLRQLKVV